MRLLKILPQMSLVAATEMEMTFKECGDHPSRTSRGGVDVFSCSQLISHLLRRSSVRDSALLGQYYVVTVIMQYGALYVVTHT